MYINMALVIGSLLICIKSKWLTAIFNTYIDWIFYFNTWKYFKMEIDPMIASSVINTKVHVIQEFL